MCEQTAVACFNVTVHWVYLRLEILKNYEKPQSGMPRRCRVPESGLKHSKFRSSMLTIFFGRGHPVVFKVKVNVKQSHYWP
jgi:hypothetical protein